MFENYQPPKEFIPSDPRFGCGPSLVPVEFVDRLRETGVHLLGTSHRKEPVKNLCKEIQQGLKSYFGLEDDKSIVLGNGGATLLFDMIGLGAVEKKSTHFTSGEFSSKWFSCHNSIPWITAEKIGVDFGQGITPENVDGSDMLCMTLNETSTGVIIDKLPEKKEALIAVDATSGGGQVPCDVNGTDIYFFSPQKVFASEGGFYVAILSQRARERVLKIEQDKSRYIPGIMDWKAAIENSDKGQTYNTPSISTLFFLNEQIKEMNKVGYSKVQEMAWEKARHVYSWANEKDYLSPYVADEKYRSNAVATIDVDEKVPVDGLLDRLGELKIVYGIDAYRKLGRNQFRIALFHNITLEDTRKLTSLLSHAIESSL